MKEAGRSLANHQRRRPAVLSNRASLRQRLEKGFCNLPDAAVHRQVTPGQDGVPNQIRQREHGAHERRKGQQCDRGRIRRVPRKRQEDRTRGDTVGWLGCSFEDIIIDVIRQYDLTKA